MELKVRVDGMLRVVCGVSEQTTCQEVVIALAHAMGRTGRFTLIEKWRDSERPLLPSDYPVKVLQKWGEYANEVQLLLHQSDKTTATHSENIPKQVQAQEKLVPSAKPVIKEKEVGLRRVLTFSGPHSSAAPRLTGSARGRHRVIPEQRSFESIKENDTPHTRGRQNQIRHAQMNGVLEESNFHPAYRNDSSTTAYQGFREERLEPTQPAFRVHSKEAKHVKLNNEIENGPPKPQISEYQNVQTGGIVPPHLMQNRTRGVSPQRRNPVQTTNFAPDHNHRLRNGQYVRGDNAQTKDPLPAARDHRHVPNQQFARNENNQRYDWPDRHQNHSDRAYLHPPQNYGEQHTNLRTSPYSHKNPTMQQNPAPYNQNFPIMQHQSKGFSGKDVQRDTSPFSHNHARTSAFQPIVTHAPNIMVVNGEIEDVPLYSGAPPSRADVEEYDLDSHLPGVGHTSAKQLQIEEYRMPGDGRHGEQDLSPTDTTPVEDPEVVRMKKLVTLQQDRLKSQEAQINGIDSGTVGFRYNSGLIMLFGF